MGNNLLKFLICRKNSVDFYCYDIFISRYVKRNKTVAAHHEIFSYICKKLSELYT